MSGETSTSDTMFASRSVRVHWARGIAGLALVVLALALTPAYGAGIWIVALPALVLWRGCPTCWTLGLMQTKQVCAIRGR
ncbi:hypothetical protein KLP28_12330 [Nocardioidaceae bacterium]|nr:hypothetical protein KLP28_12330 [Nocardioidaceae bacterium]